MQTY
ncbi:hypothetical protein KGM_211511A, partial [Danaus plexippus plexippus]